MRQTPIPRRARAVRQNKADAISFAPNKPAADASTVFRSFAGTGSDHYEREADTAARSVLDIRSPATPPSITPFSQPMQPQAKAVTGGPKAAPPQATTEPLPGESSGTALPAEARRSFEPRFGRDLSHVRLHTGPTSARLAAGISAHAFTIGNDIHFGHARYNLGTAFGRMLLAHEITHTLQQRDGAEGVQRFGYADATRWVTDHLIPEEYAPFATDLFASIGDVENHAVEILAELGQSIIDHWIAFSATFIAFLTGEAFVGGLAAVPEPTFLTKVAAFIVQALLLAAMGVTTAVELYQSGTHLVEWWRLVGEAHGDRAKISEASRALCRGILHIGLAVMAAAGIQARIRGVGAAGRAVVEPSPPAPPPPSPPTVQAAMPRQPPQLSVIHGEGMRPAPRRVSSGGGGRGGPATARALQPEVAPAPNRPPLEAVPDLPPEVAPPVPEVAPTPSTPSPVAPLRPTGPTRVGNATSTGVAATDIAADVSDNPSAPPAPQPEPESQPDPPPQPQSVVLNLPPEKAAHLAIYRDLIFRRQLQHRVGRDRDTDQRGQWDGMMHPRRGGEMQVAVYNYGTSLGLCEARIFRPSWTRRQTMQDFQVDHIIEYQVAPIGGEAMIDLPWNFELLDSASNGASGSKLRANIASERTRLAAINPIWATADLTFTHVTVVGSASVDRWSKERIGDGLHLSVFARSGLTPEDVCP